MSASTRRRRHQLRDRIAARQPVPGCPRPDKPAYNADDPAERAIQERRLGPGMDMYPCKCGYSHNGHPRPAEKGTRPLS